MSLATICASACRAMFATDSSSGQEVYRPGACIMTTQVSFEYMGDLVSRIGT